MRVASLFLCVYMCYGSTSIVCDCGAVWSAVVASCLETIHPNIAGLLQKKTNKR